MAYGLLGQGAFGLRYKPLTGLDSWGEPDLRLSPMLYEASFYPIEL